MNILIVNKSTMVTDEQIQAIIPAVEIQLNRDFAPIWLSGSQAITINGSGPADYTINLLDDADQAGALGYHDLLSDSPEAKVFIKDDINSGSSWSVTISHELLEMLVDPLANLSALTPDGSKFYGYEVCDAPEDDQFSYEINGVKVSDFVYPSWFEGDRAPGSTQFDYGSHITAPFQLLSGGYAGYLDLSNISAGWQQQTMDRAPTRISQRFLRRQRKFLKL